MKSKRIPKDFVDHVEQALLAAWEQGRQQGHDDMLWKFNNQEMQLDALKKGPSPADRQRVLLSAAQVGVDALKNISYLLSNIK